MSEIRWRDKRRKETTIMQSEYDSTDVSEDADLWENFPCRCCFATAERILAVMHPAPDALLKALITWYKLSSWQGSIVKGVELRGRIDASLSPAEQKHKVTRRAFSEVAKEEDSDPNRPTMQERLDHEQDLREDR